VVSFFETQCIYMRPCYRWSIAWSVCRSVCHDRERCKMLNRSGGSKELCINWGPDPRAKGQFSEDKGRPIVQYTDSLP